MEKYIELLKAGGADLALVIDPATVVTEPWVEFKCRYGCPRYGKSYCCPPHSPDYKRTREILDSFRRALLFRCHSMDGGTPLALSVGKALAVDGYYKAIAFGCGPCTKCETCALDHCRFAGQAAPSMEACGIDVFSTVRAHGLEIGVLSDKNAQPNIFGLILVD